jgi:hypothetical protein
LLLRDLTKKQKYLIGGGVVAVLFLIIPWFINNRTSPPISELAKTTSNNEHYLSSKIIPETDLPPEGTRSLFDHLIVQNGGIVPYPFSKLIEMLKEQNPSGAEPISLLIPNGRSLLKGQADNAHPRIVTTADFESANTGNTLGFAPRGQLFLGFVENANEIEVVSYNEAAGRFEFQLVQNYCQDCGTRIVYARRAICSTCHQGGTPIFSQRPWNETNGQPATANAVALARGNREPYQSVPIQQPLSQSERFDQLTDVGNFFYATQRLWLDGCGEKGNECRKKMLSLAFQYLDNAGGFNPNSPEANELRKLQEAAHQQEVLPNPSGEQKYTPIPLALQGNVDPKKGIIVPESDLANRDPIGERQGFKGWLRSLFTRDIKFGEGARDNEDLSEFEKLPPLRRELDPLTIRAPKQVLTPNDIDGVYGLASFFTESDLKLLNSQNGYDIKRVIAKIQKLPNEIFDPKPFSRISIMEALLGKKQSYCCLNTSEMSPPIVSGGPPLTIKEFPELQPFADNCFTCHRGNPALKLNFMGGETEKEVLENIKAKKEIRDALDWERYEGTDKSSKLMPPRNSSQYRKLKEAGEEGKKALQKMRDTVPSFFNF